MGALLRTPAAVLADTVLLVRLLGPELRRRGAPAGQLRTLELTGQPDEVREEGWQAVAGLVLSLSPGSFVLDSGGGPPTLLVHAVGAEPSLAQQWVRR